MERKGKKSPVTGAVRQEKYRKRKMEEDREAWIQKCVLDQKNYRARMTEEKKEEVKRKDRLRKKVKVLENRKTEKGVYKSASALGKAKTKVVRALPKDPERALEVVNGVHRIIRRKVEDRIDEVQEESKSPKKKIRTDIKNQIFSFYYRQDVSVTLPGQKDYVMVKNVDGKRSKMTKHILCMTLREAYMEFCKETEIDISLDAFSKLRPRNVLLRHKLPKNVCVCRYHANINYLISALHSYEKSFPCDHKALLMATTCAEENLEKESCQLGNCRECKELSSLSRVVKLLESSMDILRAWYVKYYRWEEVEDCDWKQRIRKIQKEGSVYMILKLLLEDWPSSRVHRLVKVKQDKQFNWFHGLRDKTSVLLQFDFSENAEVQEQDEIQAAHWWHLTVTIFTACAWVNGFCISFAVVSDFKQHDKHFTIIALLKIIKRLLNEFIIISNLHLFSDGAAQHFKQRFFINAVTLLPQFLGIPADQIDIDYNLFSTSHGKGAVDGVGGTVKRMVMAEVISRRANIQTSQDYATVAKKVCRGVNIIHISKEDVEAERSILDLVAFNQVKSLNGIRKLHNIQVLGPKKVQCSIFSGSSDRKQYSL